jgi:hypothetical protein
MNFNILARELFVLKILNTVTVNLIVNRDSVFGSATGYGLGDRRVGVRVPVGSRIFFSPRRPDRL